MNEPFFEIRGVYECGWNIFNRKGFSDDPAEISVNYQYLDHLSMVGINWVVVFWANSRGFDEAWRYAAQYAHSVGIKVAKGVYAFSGGGPEYSMAEPEAPEHLLCASPKGPKTALCPFDEKSREWMSEILTKRIEPDIDGIFIEPAREISRNCICPKCQGLRPYEWDVFVINFLAGRIRHLKSDIEVFPYVYMNGSKWEKQKMAEEFHKLRPDIHHIFAWGADDEQSLVDWLQADHRFSHYAKLGRALLFPEGKPPANSAEERVARIFKWCRLAADWKKDGYLFDYRVFGGREWQGHWEDTPRTRVSANIPASLAVIGAAMRSPYLDEQGQRQLLDDLRESADWDLDEPVHFYKGRGGQ